MDDVAIIGVGLHPFGRFGPKSALEMGADAIRAACTDAGVQWSDVQFAFGGSCEVDNPDAVVGLVGITGIPFMDVYNGCATAATALQLAADAIQSGQLRHRRRRRHGQAPAGRLHRRPRSTTAPRRGTASRASSSPPSSSA